MVTERADDKLSGLRLRRRKVVGCVTALNEQFAQDNVLVPGTPSSSGVPYGEYDTLTLITDWRGRRNIRLCMDCNPSVTKWHTIINH